MFDVRIHDAPVLAELDRLSDMHTVALRLESLLSRQYQATQRVVHVLTGSLRHSGDIDSRWSGDRWTGQVSYGGPAPGFPNDPVVYAVYEAARGGAHDFMAPAADMGAQYRDIVVDHVRGHP